MTCKKYELTDIVHRDHSFLRRIRALCDIPGTNVKSGDLGGWVEGEHNLSQDGSAWVYSEARVYGEAVVSESANVTGEARVFGYAQVRGSAQVYGFARVFGKAVVSGDAHVSGNAIVQTEEDILQAYVTTSETFSATLHRTEDGHRLKVGCWAGTVGEFRDMIESDEWIEASPEQVELRRPELLAFVAMCEARIATWER